MLNSRAIQDSDTKKQNLKIWNGVNLAIEKLTQNSDFSESYKNANISKTSGLHNKTFVDILVSHEQADLPSEY